MIISGTTISGVVIKRASTPAAPSIGSVTYTLGVSDATATIQFTGPTYDGGSPVTSYTATSNTGGLTATVTDYTPIVISGLTLGQPYTFTVTATNLIGTSSPSDVSEVIIAPFPTGQVEFTSDGTYQWVVPYGVYSISAVAVGAGERGDYGSSSNSGGVGGSLAYINNYAVTPGTTITVIAGATSSTTGGLSSMTDSQTFLLARGGGTSTTNIGTGKFTGGNGGSGYNDVSTKRSGGGGGAGGYTAAGGRGGYTILNINYESVSGANSTGGGGGGGGGSGASSSGGGGGGGVGLYGLGTNGIGSSSNTGGTGGSGGTNGSNQISGSGGNAGAFGGGGGAGAYAGGSGGFAGRGAVRIIWPGNLRQFPSTRTADE